MYAKISIAPEAEARGSGWHQYGTPACAARAATRDDSFFLAFILQVSKAENLDVQRSSSRGKGGAFYHTRLDLVLCISRA